jgi:hypothetical protein
VRGLDGEGEAWSLDRAGLDTGILLILHRNLDTVVLQLVAKFHI